MNRQEFDKFCDRLFMAFPGIRDYVNERSPSPSGTKEIWFRTVYDVTYDEAEYVLGRWIDCKDEPPKAYERDNIFILIRSKVGFRRSQYAAKKREHDYQQREKRAKQTREALSAIGLDEIYDRWLPKLAAYQSGEITKQDLNKIMDQLTELAK